MTTPEGTDQTVDNKTLTVNQYASVQIPWTGEDIKHVNNGSGYETIYGDQIAQSMRAITNTIEAYVAGIAKAGSSRAFGTAGTIPFGSNFNEIAEIRQILVDIHEDLHREGVKITRKNLLMYCWRIQELQKMVNILVNFNRF